MERHFAAVSGALPVAPLRTQFLRIIILVLAGTLISSQLSIAIVISSPPPTNVDVLRNSSRAIAVNSSQLQATSSKQVFHEEAYHHRNRSKSVVSSYIRAARQRQQKHQHRKRGSEGPDHYVNLRKLSFDFGCLSDPAICLTVPGWTLTSNSSTCCSSGFCTDIQFDFFNCGACDQPCDFGYFCCSGVCVALASDPLNCGRCGYACKGGVCGYGLCSY